MGPYRLVVFDWEGTLGDTFGEFILAIIQEANKRQYGEVSLETARYYIPSGPVVAIKKLFPHLPPHEQAALLEAVQKTVCSHSGEVCLIPGAAELLYQLKTAGFQLGIATNRSQQSLQRDLEASGLLPLFNVTRCAGQTPAKPCPQMLQEIMDICGVTADQTLMVGDSASDVEMAQAVNVRCIGVDFYHQNELILEACGAYKIFDDFQQLRALLL